MSARRFWPVVGLVYAVVVAVFAALGVPAPFLLAGVVAGAACALGSTASRTLPTPARRLAMGVIGMEAGSHVDTSVLSQLADNPVAVFGSAVATLVVTLAVGQLLRLSPRISGATATFASVAGGASGITALARELRADAVTVVAIQYLRVLVVVTTVPVVAPLLGGARAAPTDGAPADYGMSALFIAVVLGLGLGLARLWAFTASTIIFPMLLAAALTALDVFEGAEVLWPVSAIGFALIGLMVGLDLTRATLRQVAEILPLALGTLVLGLVACAGVGLLLAHLTGISFYSAYLATTPGGLPAVMAFAVTTGDDVGFVVTCQVLRVFFAISLGAVVASVLRRRGERPVGDS